ncbi:solute carrier organic anion transporter family member 1C1-like [Pelobates cultripes]|uniref:Solute carrier organic anion transporter family member n=2 Tax=Pelobates cultripes TaxID=61616 RepID=A0AAD1RYJ2_PELCU|nr:solute carrier organic anion transporter family member 1C1-like [Pelobates cultripes]
MTVDNNSSELNKIHSTPNPPVTKNEEKIPPKKESCCDTLKLFLASLCFAYFAKAFSGSYMKSSITQIERRFDLSSSIVGIIDGSFEFGNLLVLVLVSYFGAKFHRPRIIAGGCLVMTVGSLMTALPHFFMGPYKYEAVSSHTVSRSNVSLSFSPCLDNQTFIENSQGDCTKEIKSYWWIFMLIGNMLRGIGETPITPLGVSYIDDFSRPENTALYIACLHTVALFGPMTGFMLGSFCAKLYVDIGFVDLDSITIDPRDTRWVGAWWLGFLVAAGITLLSGIPFCFLPKSLKKQSEDDGIIEEKMKMNENKEEPSNSEQHRKLTMKGFLLSLKQLLCTPLYSLLLLMTFLQMNSFLGFITYKPKYIEQQYGQSISKANFITGISTLPAAALGVFLGGLIMKRYKFGLLSASKMSFGTGFLAFLFSFVVFILGCENSDVAGITVSYNGSQLDVFQDEFLYSPCNADCRCSLNRWDPVCGENDVTYMSACLAGCKGSVGTGKERIYYNCSCIEAMGFKSSNFTARLGTCPRNENCGNMFIYYTISQTLITFVYALGGAAAYIIVLWCVSPELKALAVGVYMLLIRALAGIPAPIYFGALIDKTCLKWGTKPCGGKGACRMYDASSFRNTFLGLMTGIRAPMFLVAIVFIYLVKKQISKTAGKNAQEKENREDSVKSNIYSKDIKDEESAALNSQKESCM